MATSSKTGRNRRRTSNHRRSQHSTHSSRPSYQQAVHGTGHAYQQAANNLRRSYQQAGSRTEDLQDKAFTWWHAMLGSEIWQKHIEQIADHSIPLAQRNLRQMMEFIEKSGRAKARLMNQLADAIQSSSPAEAQAKFAELWTSGFKAVQSNLGDISELISRTLESWTGFFRKTVEAG